MGMKKVKLKFKFLMSLACFLGSILSLGASEAPNIVLFFVDDLGQRDLGVYGSDFHETPNMDQLAQDGMRFDGAYSAYSRCVPSRQGLLSGKYPSRLDQKKKVDHYLPLDEVTFGEALQEAGYHTAYMGKWHLGKKGGTPGDQGFETTVHTGSPGAPHSYFFPFPMEKNGYVENPIVGKEGDYLTDVLADEAESFILGRKNKKEPFLLVFADYSVHTPFEAPEASIEYFRDKLAKMQRDEGGKSGPFGKADADLKKDRVSETKSIQNNPIYAAMLKHTDDALGKITAALDAIGETENTIVILTSDHGGLSSRGAGNGRPLATSNFPFRQGKGSIFEGGTRVPLMVKWPNVVEPNSKSEVQVTGTDHYPTMLEMAGAPLRPEQHLDGVSYTKALKGETYVREPMFWYKWQSRPDSTGDTQAISYVDGRYKVIDWWSENKIELFDLKEDVGEQNDLSSSKPELTKKLLAKLHEKEEEIGNLREQGVKALKNRMKRLEQKKNKHKNKKNKKK